MSGKLEQALFKIAQNNTGLSALITAGSPAVTRFYPDEADQPPTYPFNVYSTVSQTVENAMGTGTTDLKRRRIQVDCWDKTAKGARILADAVEAAFDRYQATVTVTGGSVDVQDIYIVNRVNLFDFEARKFKVAVDLDIPYLEH